MHAYSCKSVFAAVNVHFSATSVCSCNSGTVALAVEENHRGASYKRERWLKDIVNIVNRILRSGPFSVSPTWIDVHYHRKLNYPPRQRTHCCRLGRPEWLDRSFTKCTSECAFYDYAKSNFSVLCKPPCNAASCLTEQCTCSGKCLLSETFVRCCSCLMTVMGMVTSLDAVTFCSCCCYWRLYWLTGAYWVVGVERD